MIKSLKESCIIDFIHSLKKRTYLLFPIWFKAKHSVTHALIQLPELIRKQLDGGSYCFGIYVDFQKAFDTVDHDILLEKLEHYDTRGISSKRLASCLSKEINLCGFIEFRSG